VRIGKPRSPQRARRVHGPAAAFAGYKNGAAAHLSLLFPFLPFHTSQQHPARDAWFLDASRIRPFCLAILLHQAHLHRPRQSWDSCIEQDPPDRPLWFWCYGRSATLITLSDHLDLSYISREYELSQLRALLICDLPRRHAVKLLVELSELSHPTESVDYIISLVRTLFS
jgi:hypothetical protein